MSFCIYDENVECNNCGACEIDDNLTEEDREIIKDLNSIN